MSKVTGQTATTVNHSVHTNIPGDPGFGDHYLVSVSMSEGHARHSFLGPGLDLDSP